MVGDHEHHESGLLNAKPHIAACLPAVAAAFPLLPLGGGSGGGDGMQGKRGSSSCSIFSSVARISRSYRRCTGSDLGTLLVLLPTSMTRAAKAPAAKASSVEARAASQRPESCMRCLASCGGGLVYLLREHSGASFPRGR